MERVPIYGVSRKRWPSPYQGILRRVFAAYGVMCALYLTFLGTSGACTTAKIRSLHNRTMSPHTATMVPLGAPDVRVV